MNCLNCGAPTELVGQGNHYFCGYCESYRFAEPLRGSVDGIVPTPNNADFLCPVCDDRQLSRGALDSARVEFCDECRGILLPSESLPALLVEHRQRYPDGDGQPTPLNPQELQRRIGCPACGLAMEAHPYHGPGNAVIDSCFRCRLVWLDHGEFTILHRARAARIRAAKLAF
jgi:Zn-finger nucleic acid-binding protein